jgi:pimeloyl-ACP methyl ester carboxylesterase
MQRCELVTGRHRIPVVLFGEGKRCLVCVNGAQQTMNAWGSLARRFAVRAGYRVVLFDFPGQGSALTAEGGLGLIEQAELLQLVVSQVSPVAPVDLCGASWGAQVAAACAARYPALVGRLLLLSFQVRTNARVRRVAIESLRLIELAARRELAEHVIKEFGAGLAHKFRAAIRAQFVRLSAGQLAQAREQCATLAAGADLRQLVDLGRISADTLIVNGADDPLIDAADTATTADCFPHAELRVVRGVGHFLHLEQESVMDTYLEFVQSSLPALT